MRKVAEKLSAVCKAFFGKIKGTLVSPFELVVASFMAISLAFLLYFNISDWSELKRIKTTKEFYSELKRAFFMERASRISKERYYMRSLEGERNLPAPLNTVLLPKGVRLNYLLKAENIEPTENRRIYAYQVAPERGDIKFRYLEINGAVIEAVIKEEGRDE